MEIHPLSLQPTEDKVPEELLLGFAVTVEVCIALTRIAVLFELYTNMALVRSIFTCNLYRLPDQLSQPRTFFLSLYFALLQLCCLFVSCVHPRFGSLYIATRCRACTQTGSSSFGWVITSCYCILFISLFINPHSAFSPPSH